MRDFFLSFRPTLPASVLLPLGQEHTDGKQDSQGHCHATQYASDSKQAKSIAISVS